MNSWTKGQYEQLNPESRKVSWSWLVGKGELKGRSQRPPSKEINSCVDWDGMRTDEEDGGVLR